jgi:hypothetical protein
MAQRILSWYVAMIDETIVEPRLAKLLSRSFPSVYNVEGVQY